jgi:hypothetical protein
VRLVEKMRREVFRDKFWESDGMTLVCAEGCSDWLINNDIKKYRCSFLPFPLYSFPSM